MRTIIREILVHLKAHEQWSGHIDHAVALAAHFEARLHALVTFSEISILRALSHRDHAAVLAQESRDADSAAKLRKQVEAAAQAKGIEHLFSTAEGPASELVLWASRFHDLTVIEQRDPRADELGYDPAEETVLASGRPILVLPRAGQFKADPKHILIAWNGSQQSAAALHGALPFIDQTAKVTICIGEDRQRLRGNLRYPPLELASFMKRRVKEMAVEAVEVRGDDVGPHLLSRANDLGADLLVMGAYGRSWYSEMLLGGATRHILRHLTVPVLMGR